MAFTPVTVTARFLEADNETPAKGSVEFRLTNDMAQSGVGTILASSLTRANLDENGEISVVLSATNDPNTLPLGTLYEVTERIRTAPSRSYLIALDYEDDTYDLSEVAPYGTSLLGSPVVIPGGPVGPPGPQGPPGGIPVTLGTVYLDVPASGATSGKDKATVLAAITSVLTAPKGGRIVFAAGTYDVGDLALLWPEYNVTGKQLILQGQGKYVTKLLFSVDRGAGTYAIAGNYSGGALRSDQGGLYENEINDMTIQGPGSRPGVMGVSPADMNGVMADTHVNMNRVSVLFFNYGTHFSGNHNFLTECTIGNNYYGAYHSAVSGLGGDVNFTNCNMAGNLHSSHAVSPTGVASLAMYQGHVGFGPFALYMESGRAANALGFAGCNFYATSFEYIGNGMLYSEDQNAHCTEMRWYGCGNFSSNNPSYGLPSTTMSHQVRVMSFTNSHFIASELAGAPQTAWIDVTDSLNNVSLSHGYRMYSQSVSTGVPIVLGPSLGNQARVNLTDDEGFRAVIIPPSWETAIVAGRIMEWTQFGHARPHAHHGESSRTPIAGIAGTAAAASSRTFVVVIQEHFDVLVDIDGPEPTSVQVLVPSSTTYSKAMAVSWDGTIGTLTRPIIGQFYLAGAPAGKTKARIRI